MNKTNLKIIFLGTPEFSVPTLEALIKNNMKPFLIITQPDKPIGRRKTLIPSPVKELALKNNIKIAQPQNKKELKELFSKLDVDICILVAYGMIIPDEVLNRPKYGFINIHPSMLPKYRGPSPIQSALLNGESKTGVTVMKITSKMDEGPIIVQQEVKIDSSETSSTLHDRLSFFGADLVVDILPDYLDGKIDIKEQDSAEASYCKMIVREDGLVNWSKTAREINDQFRAFWPWPGIFTSIENKRLKITKIAILEEDFDSSMSSGQVFLDQNKNLAIMCGQGAISLILVQPEGRQEMSGQEFINGHQELVGTILS